MSADGRDRIGYVSKCCHLHNLTEKTIEITSMLNVKLSINFCILIPNQSQNPEMPARFMPVDVEITLMAGAMDQHISLIFIE